MARPLRIEYPGATYHVMCRGTRGTRVFGSDQDAELWVETLEDCIERTGWLVHAWVLMATHYHLLAETPEANLVWGMKWFQGTFTQRLNVRHKTWGHVYQGRYKAKIIESENPEYFRRVGTYIHLNPAAVGRAKGPAALAAYRWGSYGEYLVSPSRRRPWLQVRRVLASVGIGADTKRGREEYRDYLQGRMRGMTRQFRRSGGRKEWERLERGWVHGSPEYRERMLDVLEEEGKFDGGRVEDGEQVRDHGELGAARFLRRCLKGLGMAASDLESLRKGDERKALMAGSVKARYAVGNRWISEQLNMGNVATVSRSMCLYRHPPRRILRMKKQIDVYHES